MNILTWVARILVGVLFIISGLIKANDPLGFAYKLDEYFEVFADDIKPEQDNLQLIVLQGGDTVIKQEKALTTLDSIFVVQMNVESVVPDTAEGTIIDTSFMEYKVSSLINGIGKEMPHFAPEGSEFIYMLSKNGEILLKKTVSKIPGKSLLESEQVNVYEHVKQENPLVGFFLWLQGYSLFISMFICILEVVMGFALIMGLYGSLTSWILLLMILFFTFLTGYSAYFNKVTDCGCFGDALKITPTQSFFKDVALLVLSVIIFIGQKYIRPHRIKIDLVVLPVSLILIALFSVLVIGWWLPVIFSLVLFILFVLIKIFTKNRQFIGWLTLLAIFATTLFTLWAYHHLPFADFRPYAEGKNICEQMKLPPDAQEQITEINFIYENKETGEQVEIAAANFGSSIVAQNKNLYKYVDREMIIIQEADVPKIEAFPVLDDEGNDIHDSILNLGGYKFLVIAYDLEKTNTSRWENINNLQHQAEQAGMPFYGLTSSAGQIEAFRHEHQAAFPFYSSDAIILKTVVRSNPGVVLLKDCEVVDKWHWRDIPNWKNLGLD